MILHPPRAYKSWHLLVFSWFYSQFYSSLTPQPAAVAKPPLRRGDPTIPHRHTTCPGPAAPSAHTATVRATVRVTVRMTVRATVRVTVRATVTAASPSGGRSSALRPCAASAPQVDGARPRPLPLVRLAAYTHTRHSRSRWRSLRGARCRSDPHKGREGGGRGAHRCL